MRPVARHTLIRLLLIVAMLLSAVFFYRPVYGQATVRVFNPTPVTVELSGKEPPSPDLATSFEIVFTPGGGCGSWSWNCAIEDSGGPVRIVYPIAQFVNIADHIGVHDRGATPNDAASITVCGYLDDVQPIATVTTPSGKAETLGTGNPPYVKVNENRENCWNFPVRLGLGAELGTYKVTITHSQGNLEQTWTEDLLYCPKKQWIGNTNNQVLLTGYTAGEKLRIHFYAQTASRPADPNDTSGIIINTYGYVASRDVQIDDMGTLLLTIDKARSADFSDDIQYQISRIDPLPAAKYPTYQVEDYACGIFDLNNPRYTGQIAPSNTGTVPIYANVNDTGAVSFELASGEPVLILETTPVAHDTATVFWTHIQTEDGREGWIAGRTLLNIYTLAVAGAQGISDAYTPGSLLAEPNPDANHLAELPVKTSVTVVQERVVTDSVNGELHFLYVQSAVGNGWVSASSITVLPWKPVSIEGITVP
jgi:hypothetical protein